MSLAPQSKKPDVILRDILQSWIHYVRHAFTLKSFDHVRIKPEQEGGPVLRLSTEESSVKGAGAAKGVPVVFAKWESHILARVYAKMFLHEIRNTLDTLRELLNGNGWTSIEMPDSVVENLRKGVAKLEKHRRGSAAVAASSGKPSKGGLLPGNMASVLHDLRQSLFMIQEGSHSELLQSDAFFPLEFKAAVYFPVLLPAVMPLIGIMRRNMQTKKS